MVRAKGLEPSWGYPHMDLNHARLPIPPRPREMKLYLCQGLHVHMPHEVFTCIVECMITCIAECPVVCAARRPITCAAGSVIAGAPTWALSHQDLFDLLESCIEILQVHDGVIG